MSNVTLDSFIKEDPMFSNFLKTKDKENLDFYLIYEVKDFSIMIMSFPEKICYPLHDHRDMMVCTKVLKGEIHNSLYDFKNDSQFYSDLRKSEQNSFFSFKNNLSNNNIDLNNNQENFPYIKVSHNICNLYN